MGTGTLRRGGISLPRTPEINPVSTSLWLPPGPPAFLGGTIGEAPKTRPNTLNWGFIAAAGTAGLFLATALSFGIRDRYISAATVRVDPGPQGDADTARREVELAIRNVLSRRSLSSFIQSPKLDLYKSDRARRPLEDVIRDMKANDLKITSEAAGTFRLEYRGESPEQAQTAVRLLITRLFDEQINRQRSLFFLARDVEHDTGQKVPIPSGIGLDVQSPPTLDTAPVYPNRPVIAFIGLIAGLLAVPVITLIRRSPRVWLRAASGLLLCSGLIGFLPLPYESEAQIVFDSPFTLQTLTKNFPAEIAFITDNQGTALTIKVHNSDRFVAQRDVQRAVSRIIEGSARIRPSQSLPSRMISGPWGEVLDPPTLPVHPLGDAWRDRIALASFILALLSGALLYYESRCAPRAVPPA